jgi:ABC-type nitrate/sulfonate/bicarbonate transport system substrate-binding protein
MRLPIRRYRRRLAVLVVTTGLVGSACGGGTSNETATGDDAPTTLASDETTTTAIAVEFDRIVVAARGSIDASPLWVADSEGFFAAENIEVDFAPVSKELALFESIKEGEAQVAVVSAGTAIRRISFNKDELRLSVYLDGTQGELGEDRGTMSLVSADDELSNGCDLASKRIGVDSLSSLTAVAIREKIARDGCDPLSVVFVLGDSPSHLEGLETGDLDAAALLDPYTARALRTDYQIIANLDNELCPDYGRCPISIVVTDSDWATANDEVLARFTKALDQAMLWIRSNELRYRAELVTCCAMTADDASDVRVPNFVGERRHLPSDMLRLVDILIAQNQVSNDATEALSR